MGLAEWLDPKRSGVADSAIPDGPISGVIVAWAALVNVAAVIVAFAAFVPADVTLLLMASVVTWLAVDERRK
jgi:hypothetical protein